MDIYKEQLVKKATTSKEQAKKTVILIGGIFTGAAIMMIVLAYFTSALFLGLVAAVGVVYGAFYFVKDMQTEYEYLFTNGDLDIDKIMGQRKRKRLTTVKIASVTDFGKLTDDCVLDGDKTVIDASSGYDEDHWYLEFAHREYGASYLYFTPNDELLQLIKDSLPRTVKAKIKE